LPLLQQTSRHAPQRFPLPKRGVCCRYCVSMRCAQDPSCAMPPHPVIGARSCQRGGQLTLGGSSALQSSCHSLVRLRRDAHPVTDGRSG
jgi:hypothetical protein